MKIRIQYQSLDETFVAKDANEVLHKVKGEAAKRAPFLLRGVVNAMSDLKFAQEVVSRANSEFKRQDPAPQSAQAFLDWAVSRGYVSILEP